MFSLKVEAALFSGTSVYSHEATVGNNAEDHNLNLITKFDASILFCIKAIFVITSSK
jgi:hypothetical protein